MELKPIALVKTEKYYYPIIDNFRPSEYYPEYPFSEISNEENHIYHMVREGFRFLEMDSENYGTPEWNPFGYLINPGEYVLLKPNLVMDENHIKENGTDCLYSQASVVAALIDYVIIALKGEGHIIVGDAPMQECRFDVLVQNSGYKKLIEYYKERLKDSKIEIELVDFRGVISNRNGGINYSKETDAGYKIVDIANESEFWGSDSKYLDNLRITNYDPALLKGHHNEVVNEYCVSDHILKADVIINVPKPKTHRKAGVTISLKNLVGINCRKEFLPHHSNGSKIDGGDEFLERSLVKKFSDRMLDKRNYHMQTTKRYGMAKMYTFLFQLAMGYVKRFRNDKTYEGSWYGNDTISKTIVDLNKILLYADKNGILCENQQRKVFIVADMIISGEKEGPVSPSKKDVGIIAMGMDPVCFDEVVAKLMGAKIEEIPTLKRARFPKGKLKLTEESSVPYCLSNKEEWNKRKIDELKDEDLLYFLPTSGWIKAFKERV